MKRTHIAKVALLVLLLVVPATLVIGTVFATAVAPVYVSVNGPNGYGDVVIDSQWGSASFTPNPPWITAQGSSTNNPGAATTVTEEIGFTGDTMKAYTEDGQGAAGIDIEYTSKSGSDDALNVTLFVEWSAGPTSQDTDYDVTWKQKSMSVNWEGKITVQSTADGNAKFRVFTSEISDDISNIGAADIPIMINPAAAVPDQYRWYHAKSGPGSLDISDTIANKDCAVTRTDGTDIALTHTETVPAGLGAGLTWDATAYARLRVMVDHFVQDETTSGQISAELTRGPSPIGSLKW